MSYSKHREAGSQAEATTGDSERLGLTRRTVLAGAAATAAITFGGEARADNPPTADPNSPQDMDAFVKMSAALTGIAVKMLAPDTDSLGLRQAYFDFLLKSKDRAAGLATLLQVAKSVNLPIPTDPAGGGIIQQGDVDNLVQAIAAKGDDARYFARSVTLMWYLGAWYEPKMLQALAAAPDPSKIFVDHTVVSAKAYTQGWLWRVAQAHPMGYSDMQFGYWTREPQPLPEFIAVQPPKPLPLKKEP
jgi:hypothetical protein